MHNYEDKEMQLLFKKSLYRLQPSFSRSWSWRPAFRRWRKIRLEKILPLLRRDECAFASSILPIDVSLSGRDHIETRDRSNRVALREKLCYEPLYLIL